MLSALRNIQNSFFIKILLGLTALSFMSLFGISGYLGPNQNRDVAITVGKHVTPMRSLQKELDREVKRIGAIYGDNENIERALRAGLLGNIVQRATSRAILDATADDMDISISDEILREYIMQQDEFKDESGKFNHARSF